MNKIRVLMLKDVPGVDDGQYIPKNFKEGQEYEIGPDLYKSFKQMGVIESNLKKNEESHILEPKEKIEEKVIEKDYEKKVIEPDVEKKTEEKEPKKKVFGNFGNFGKKGDKK